VPALAEQHILFKAIATTTARDHFALKRIQIEFGCSAEHDVQRFVRDGTRMREDDAMR